MDTHKNASLTPRGREAMARSVIEGGLCKAAAAHQFNATPKTVAKWVGRFQAEGAAGLQDRSSWPHSSPSQTTPAQCAGIEGLRRPRHTGQQIAAEVGVLAIDDHSRLAYSEILPDETRDSCLRFLFNALRFFRSLGVKVERVMTDNGSSFRSRRYAKALRWLKIKHLRTRPDTPKTNGKAERFVQTSLREWAYATAYETSEDRAAQLPGWLHRYNCHRPHATIGAKPPISRLDLTQDNLLSLHS